MPLVSSDRSLTLTGLSRVILISERTISISITIATGTRFNCDPKGALTWRSSGFDFSHCCVKR
jgi:hypothetical protein